jgi:hypothetical protein
MDEEDIKYTFGLIRFNSLFCREIFQKNMMKIRQAIMDAIYLPLIDHNLTQNDKYHITSYDISRIFDASHMGYLAHFFINKIEGDLKLKEKRGLAHCNEFTVPVTIVPVILDETFAVLNNYENFEHKQIFDMLFEFHMESYKDFSSHPNKIARILSKSNMDSLIAGYCLREAVVTMTERIYRRDQLKVVRKGV